MTAMSESSPAVFRFFAAVSWLLLSALAQVANAHEGAHAGAQTAAHALPPPLADIAASPAARSHVASSHCPGGGSDCCCRGTWTLPPAEREATAPPLALLPQTAPPTADTVTARSYAPIARATALLHFTGPRAPPRFL
jgi:hypothetical protein